ncbi:MAG: DUF6895 family protein [Candidatus Eisenbacteria bacterium]
MSRAWRVRWWTAGRLALVIGAAGVVAARSVAGSTTVTRPATPDTATDLALTRAAGWLDTLSVDCATLEIHGVKGKKKLAEILDAEWMLWRHWHDPAIRARILGRVRDLTAQTSDPAYHDMTTCSERELREESMSYLRVAWLMERFGLDTRDYRREIAAARPRLETHLVTRGVWQRAEFERYFAAFGLESSGPIANGAPAGGVIARRVPPAGFDLDLAYDLTHEVFLRCEDPAGGRPVWGSGDLDYLHRTLPELARRALANGDPDLGAELLTAISETGSRADPVFVDGLRELIAAQNPDGTWGRYDRGRALYGTWVEQREYLHTTMVAVEALVSADGGVVGRP